MPTFYFYSQIFIILCHENVQHLTDFFVFVFILSHNFLTVISWRVLWKIKIGQKKTYLLFFTNFLWKNSYKNSYRIELRRENQIKILRKNIMNKLKLIECLRHCYVARFWWNKKISDQDQTNLKMRIMKEEIWLFDKKQKQAIKYHKLEIINWFFFRL